MHTFHTATLLCVIQEDSDDTAKYCCPARAADTGIE